MAYGIDVTVHVRWNVELAYCDIWALGWQWHHRVCGSNWPICYGVVMAMGHNIAVALRTSSTSESRDISWLLAVQLDDHIHTATFISIKHTDTYG